MRTITTCRSCDSTKLDQVIDLGMQYTSDFRTDDSKPPAHPVEAVICRDCMLVQLRHTTPSGEMYHENYGFKSGVSDSIRADLKEIVERGMEYQPNSWLDIASNDGTLLKNVPKYITRVGVDPIAKLCEEAKPYADTIINDFYTDAVIPGGQKFDVITSISCFYDMDDPNKFVSDVKARLEEKGVWIIQQNYLLTTLQLGAVDNFCHEHLTYFTLLSLEPLLARHGLEVFRVEVNMVNGGSIRTYVARKDTRAIDESVYAQREEESNHNLASVEPYWQFANHAKEQLERLHNTVKEFHNAGRRIAILAASTRGSSLWQAARIGDYVEYAVERNPAKVGRYFSAIGIPIKSEEEARTDLPDAMVVGPWFFADEIIDREADYLNKGGSLILPLPEVKVVRR